MGIIILLFSLLALSFIAGVLILFIPYFRIFGFNVLVLIGALLVILGCLLIIFTTIKNVKNPLKKYFNLVGLSAIIIFASSILHNLFYALEVSTSNYPSLSNTISSYGSGFFIIAVIIAPVTFLIFSSKAIYLLIKKRK